MANEAIADRLDILLQSQARFLRFLERRMGSRTDAEDVLQTAFLRLVAQGDSLRDDEKLIPWFYQLLRNLVVDHYRHRGAVARLDASAAAETETTTDGYGRGTISGHLHLRKRCDPYSESGTRRAGPASRVGGRAASPGG